jgi:hypothetical protein
LTVIDRFKAWWAKPVTNDEDLEPERRDELLDWAAHQAQRFGVIAPAYMFAEVNRPLMFVYSQFVHFFSPFADTFLGGKAQEVGYLMQDERNLDRFLQKLDELGEAENKTFRESAAARRASRRRRRHPDDPDGPTGPTNPS